MTVKVYIIYYSMYGHVAKLAKAAKEGVDSVEGVEGVLYQVKETLPAEVLEKMHAPPQDESIPIVDAHTIDQADGFIFAAPTRFGMMASQMKAFFDQTGQHWMKGSLCGKPAGIMTSTGTQNGGQEVTILNSITQLAHHGMIYVPPGYAAAPDVFDIEVVHGGSPYGAGTIAGGTGARQPSELELKQATVQGKGLAVIARKLKGS